MASDYLYRLWDQGQRQLAAGRYVAARGNLERAADMAVGDRNVEAVARIYLPLLEARRLIRYRAAEGGIWIPEGDAGVTHAELRAFCGQTEGTLLIRATRLGVAPAARMAQRVTQAARQTGHCLEALIIASRHGQERLMSPGAARFGCGIPIRWTQDPNAVVGSSTDPGLDLPLPPGGRYDGRTGVGGGGATARETLLIGWEALALRWQAQHPLAACAGPWQELQWLRAALQVDPACEPIAMRLMAVAEGLGRRATA